MNLPPHLKKSFAVSEILTYLNEELTTELKDFPVTVASVTISSILSASSRSQDAFDSKVSKKDSNFVLFELDWDVEMTMENVVKLMKAVPNNFHCSFNYQLQGLVTASAGFFNSVLSAGENWKLNGEYLAGGPFSWTKLVWFMVAFVKCPVLLVYARPESGKSSMNFLSSIECEKLAMFAARQDQGFRGLKGVKGVKGGGRDLGIGNGGISGGLVDDGRRSFVSKSRTLNYESPEVEDFAVGNRNSRIEVLEARLRSPQTGSITYSSKPDSLSSTNNGRHEDQRGPPLSTSTPLGIERSAYRSDIGFRAQGREELASRVSEFKFSQREDLKPQARGPANFQGQYKEESFKQPREQDSEPRSLYREDLRSQVHSDNFQHKAEDFTLRGQMREDFDLRGSKEDPRPYFRDESKFKPELSQNLSFTPSRGLRDNFEPKASDLSSGQLKQRFSSVDRPAVRSSYFRSDFKDVKDFRDPDRTENLPERLEYRSKFQDQYKNFKEKYKFLDESSAKTESMQNLNLFPRENERKFDRNLPEEKPSGLVRGLYESNTTKSQNQLSQMRGFSRFEENDAKPAEMSSFQNEPSWKNYDKYLKYGKPDSKDFEDQHEPLDHKSRADKDQQDYLRSRSIDQNLRPQSFKEPEPRHLPYERPEKSTSSLSNYPKYQSYQESVNSSIQINSKGPSEPLRKKIIRNEFTANYTPPNYELNSSSYKARLEEFSVKPEEVNSRLVENDRDLFRETKEVKRSEQNVQGGNWKCARCNKMLSSQAYECTECRLINWDQFYKVKSIQPPSDTAKAVIDVENRDLAKGGRDLDEEADWVCSACQNFNKGLFFLCKSCRRPKSYVDRQ